MDKPTWDSPAHLFGLPYTNWKRKSGCEMRGTLAECVQRFLSLPQHHQQNCILTNSASPGQWGPASIRAYVAVHGLPPQMAPVSPTRLKEMTTKKLAQATAASPVQVQDGSPWQMQGDRRKE
jgi:hypothetical protein